MRKKVNDVSNSPDEANSRNPELKPTELDILKLTCNGLTSKQVATKLIMSPKTVEFHRSNIARKTGTSHVAMLVRWAIRHKLIEP
jgi:DNA-binding CsgD family transcriptional regulator